MATRKVINGNEIELIAFDFDGTLIDSTTAIVESIQSAAADIGVPVPSDENASHIIGLGLFEALRRAVPDLPHERYQELTDRYLIIILPAIPNCDYLLALRRCLMSWPVRAIC